MPTKSKSTSRHSPARMEPQEVQLLSTTAFAAAIGVTRQHVSRLERAGIIEKHSRGRYAVSEIGKVIAFREGTAQPGDDPEAPNLTAERTLLVRAQRQKAEYELAERRGQLMTREENEECARHLATAVRDRMAIAHARCVQRLGLDRHCAEALAAEIKDAISELVTFGGLVA
jgi:hypothetical protein